VFISGVWAGATRKIVGTPKNDVLKGTPQADQIDGKAGTDRLSGLAGNDVLIGGKGNDRLTGGPGSDRLRCGPGRDVAVADEADTVGADCETSRGGPAPPAPPAPPPAPPSPPSPPPPPAQRAAAGHYCGFTNQGKSICFDVTSDSARLANFATTSDVDCGSVGATFGLSFGASTPIQSDLAFSFTYNGAIESDEPSLTNMTTSYTVSGKLDTAGNASGTLTLSRLSFDYQGTHYNCGAAPYAWQAKLGA
jgi:Ca2+-binding RTX toxin-like protein